MEAAADVQFDFDGALQLARRLVGLADQIDTMMSARVTDASFALETWLGTFGTQFAERINTENTDIATISSDLRTSADGWAVCWKEAMDEQNRRLYAREVKRVEDNRSGWDSFWGGMFGHDDLPSQPSPVAVPSGPGYAPTGSFVRY